MITDYVNSKLSSISITSGSFDDLTNFGYYWVNGASVTNPPLAGAQYWRVRVEVYAFAPNQYANRNGTSEIYFRTKSNNVWSAWAKISTT